MIHCRPCWNLYLQLA